MNNWQNHLRYNPVTPLLDCGNDAVTTLARRDLLYETVDIKTLWQLPDAQKILRKQQADGSWVYPGGNNIIRSRENYNQMETYRNLGFLVEEFAFNREHAAIQKAARYLFSFQSADGDFRGIYGNQYSPNYTAGIAELLIKAGYENDRRIKKMFDWLSAIRQRDGGWAIPIRTKDYKLDIISMSAKTVEPDKAKPYSAMVTAVVLRAFAAHPVHKNDKAAIQAGKLLLCSLFKKDNYPDRGAAEYWLRFTFPFWFTDLISAMDSLSLLGFSKEEPQIKKALDWFVNHQEKYGLWELKILKGKNRDVLKLYMALAICRVFSRMYAAK